MYTINVTFIDSLSGTSCSDQSWEPIGYKRLREAREEVEYTAPELAAEYGGPDSGIVALFHISDEQGTIDYLSEEMFEE